MTRYGLTILLVFPFCIFGSGIALAQSGPGDLFLMGNEILGRMVQESGPRYEPYRPRRSYRPAYSSPGLASAQRILNVLGYGAGAVDGRPGPRTSSAIAAFQRDSGMAVTGRFSPALLAALQEAEHAKPAPQRSEASAWTAGSSQGFTEYATRNGSSHVVVSCDEAASEDHSGTGIGLEVDGRLIPEGSRIMFDVDGRVVEFAADSFGGLSVRNCPACALKFRTIWQLIRQGKMLSVSSSSGSHARFSLAGAGSLLPEAPCATPFPAEPAPAEASATTAGTGAAAAATGPASGVPWAPDCTYLDLGATTDPMQVTGMAPADGVVCYAIKPVSGRRISIWVVSGRNVIFSVKDQVDAVDHYSFRANGMGYVVNVGQLMRAAVDEPFRMSISGGRPAEAAKPPSRSPGDGSVREKVARYFGNQNAAAGLGKSGQPDFEVHAYDLNGDGTDEAIAFLRDPSFCGSAGCTIAVLDLSGPDARSIGDFIGDTMVPLPTETNGWRDLALNGLRQVFDGHEYVAAWKLRDGSVVAYVQRLLNARGYDAGPVDGQMGGRTRTAILQFQGDAGMNATGQIDRELLLSLEKSRAGGTPEQGRAAPAAPPPASLAVHEPPRGSAERAAILDAVRPEAASYVDPPVEFLVGDLKVSGDRAFASLTAQRPGGVRIDLKNTPWGRRPDFDPVGDYPGIEALLRRRNGRWTVAEFKFSWTEPPFTDRQHCSEWRAVLPRPWCR